jgi:hypothetical protein
LIIFQPSDEPSFDELTVRDCRFAPCWRATPTQDLDSLTGLLSWDGFKTRVDRGSAAADRPMVSMLYGDIDSPAPHQRSRRLLPTATA